MPHFRQSLLIIFACAAGVLALWWYEILMDIGWSGTVWLSTNLWSPYAIVVLVVAAYLAPVGLAASPPFGKLLMAGIELYLTSLVAYFLARIVLLSLYTNVYGYLHIGGLLGVLVVVALLTAFSYWNITHRRLVPLPRRQLWWVLLAMILCLPLAWLTVRIWPGFGSGQDLIDAVKMGYPHAWLTILLGLAGWWAMQEQKRMPTHPASDVLDDIQGLKTPGK